MSGPLTSAVLHAIVSNPSTALAVPEGTPDLKHHLKNGKGFINPWDSFRDFSIPGIAWAMLKHVMSGKSHRPDTTPPTVTVRKPQLSEPPSAGKLRATWLGHACFYVEFPSGFRVLYDPVFTDRCSPFSWLGPKRYTEMPCSIDQLPDQCHAVVISHSHYDHLSLPTIHQLQKKYPNCHFFAPQGNKEWFTSIGVSKMTELDWWQSRNIELSPQVTGSSSAAKQPSSPSISATIECLPCQHVSGRTPFDRCKTLWASWSIESGGKKVWFGGDTGYRAVTQLPEGEDDYDPKYNFPHCPAFKQIGDLRGPFDLGLIPIGAYKPRWIMSPMHANPFDSVNIFADTKCKKALGMHWGTWVLTEEDVLEPPVLLKKALARHGLPEEGTFDVCEIGESREFGESLTKL